MVRTFTRSSVSGIVMTIAGVIAAFIVVAIILILLNANEGNMIINAVVEVGRFFSRPFHAMFPQTDGERDVLINWGIAALAYLLVGGVIARVAR